MLWEEDEARLIAECTEVVTRLSGKPPEGWLGPYLAQTGVTLDLLKEAGYRYVHGLGARRPADLDDDARPARSCRCPTRSSSTTRRASSSAAIPAGNSPR